MSSTDNVTYGKPAVGGAVYSAPIDTTLPTDATTALAAAFKSLGYVSEDGLTNENSPESESIKAWGGDTVLSVQTAKEDTFGYTLIEVLNVDVLKEVYGSGNVTGAIDDPGGVTITANATELEEHIVVVDVILKGGLLKRIVVPKAKVTEVGEIVYSDTDAVGYATTITALPDESGNTHYEYIVNPNIPVAYTAVANGATGTENSTSITLTLDKIVTGLTAASITITNGTGEATKGALSGTGKILTLAITNPVEGDVKLSINVTGYKFPSKTVAIYALGGT